jgi:excisionase family DNA binding protein
MGMVEEMMNTKEVARYLKIHEKQVYALIREGRIPCTKATGKWIFPKRLIDEWIDTNARSGLRGAREKTRQIAGSLLAAGSNDPVLDILQTTLRATYPEFYIFSANVGSMAGLAALNKGYTDLAWSHLYDPESGEYNIPYLARALPEVKAVVVNLFTRELGIVTALGNPYDIGRIEDLARDGLRICNRQKGSGTRLLLDQQLEQAGIKPEKIQGYNQEVYTHIECGLSVLAGNADAGIATGAVSSLLGLPFIPMTRERFDMILPQATFFTKGVQALLDVLRSEVFRKKVEPLGHYDFTASGKILYPTH